MKSDYPNVYEELIINESVTSAAATGTGGAGTSDQEWGKEFQILIRNEKSDEEVVAFLANRSIDAIISHGPKLVTVFFESVIRNASAKQGPASGEQKESEIKAVTKYKNVWKRLLQNGEKQEDQQLEALKTIIELWKQNSKPEGFTNRVFEVLFKEEIVSEKAFLKLETEADDGGFSNFITWIKEARVDSNSS